MTGKGGPDAERQRLQSASAPPSDDDQDQPSGAGGGSASATPAPPGFNEDDWFLPAELPFKLPPHEARQAVGSGKKRQQQQQPHHPPPQKRWLRLRQLLQSEGYDELPASAPTYVNMEAPPSTYPPKRYCDLTGLEAPYIDPKTGLRYANAQLFGYLRALPADAVQARLALRRAEVVLK